MNPDDDLARRSLAALAEADRSRHAPPHLERVIVDAFDRHRQPRTLDRAPAIWMHRRDAAGVAIATMIMAAVYYYGLPDLRPSPSLVPASPQVPVASRPFEQPAPTAAVSEPHPIAAVTKAVGSARRTTRVPQVRADVDATAPAWRKANDVVHSVHVQVPRTMLAMLGVPVIDPDAPGTVNVEFLLGNDGLARTIRILP